MNEFNCPRQIIDSSHLNFPFLIPFEEVKKLNKKQCEKVSFYFAFNFLTCGTISFQTP